MTHREEIFRIIFTGAFIFYRNYSVILNSKAHRIS